MSDGTAFPSPTHDLPTSSSVSPPILSETDPGAVGTGRIWVIPSTGIASVRDAANAAWIALATSGGLSNPMTTAGDIIVGGTAGAPARLAKGTDGKVLTMAAGAETWSTPAAVPAASSTVTGPDTYGDAAAAGSAATFSKGDHNHGLPAAPTPASPLTGAGGTGDTTGGSVAFASASGANGGNATLDAGHANGHSDRPGG